MKRIQSIDILRGFLMFFVIIAHRIFYQWTPYQNPTEGDVNILVLIFGFFGAMGSIFAFISGMATSFSLYNRMSSGRNTAKQVIMASFVLFLWLAIMNYFSIYFFAGGIYLNGEYRFGLFIGLLKTGQLQFPSWELISLYAGILMIIGISGFVVTLVCALLYKNNGIEKVQRNKKVIFGLGTLILIVSAFLPFVLEPIMFDAFEQKNYLLAFIIANLVAFDFPVFPLVGFALIGAALGLSLVIEENKSKIDKSYLLYALLISLFGLILAIIFLLQGQLILQFARYIHLGMFIVITLALLHLIDYKSEERKEQIAKKAVPIQRFGKVSLTIFVFETPLAAILELILNVMFTNWKDNLGYILLFGLLNILLWWIILIYWEKNNFKGSLEWTGAKIIKTLSGKSSDKLKK